MLSAGWFDTYNSNTDRYLGHPKQPHKISWSNFIYVAIVQVMNTEYRFRLSETSSHLAPFHTHTLTYVYGWNAYTGMRAIHILLHVDRSMRKT